jgi:Excalibur calcium-binding domain
MRIIGVLAMLTLASACATTTPQSSPSLLPTVASSTTSSTFASTTTTPTTTTPAVQPVALPVDLAGKTAATVEAQLRSLGFTAFRFLDQAGKQITMDPSWTVVSVDGAGSSYNPDTVIVVRVDKPAPKTSAKTAPKTATPVPPKPVAPKPQAPQPVADPPPAAAHYKNCAAVRAAGKAPIRRGQPGYGSHLDRDGDGIACE